MADATAQAGELLTELFPGLAVAGDSRLWALVAILWKLGWVYLPRLAILRAEAAAAEVQRPAAPRPLASGHAAPSPPPQAPMPSIPAAPPDRSNRPGAEDPAKRQTNSADRPLDFGHVHVVRAADLPAVAQIPPGLPRIDPAELGA